MASPRVLIIESEELTLTSLSQTFASRGATVTTARDGETGLERAESEHPDLIVLSVELPGRSGYSVCKNIKRSSTISDVPVFLLSATATAETFAQHRLLKTRAQEYFSKPVGDLEIVEKARDYVELGAAPGPDASDEAADTDAAIFGDDDAAEIFGDDDLFGDDAAASADDEG